jgi:hypothetical protein
LQLTHIPRLNVSGREFSWCFLVESFLCVLCVFAVDFEVLKKMNLFVFDIETVPDVESGRQLYGLDGLDDRNAAAMFHLRAQKTGGSEFLHHHLHRIVAISGVSPDSPPSTNEQTPPRIALA